jgi:hypothetical protein
MILPISDPENWDYSVSYYVCLDIFLSSKQGTQSYVRKDK